jgi:hypothetical protein
MAILDIIAVLKIKLIAHLQPLFQLGIFTLQIPQCSKCSNFNFLDKEIRIINIKYLSLKIKFILTRLILNIVHIQVECNKDELEALRFF